jgi:hypothetical protein
MVEGVKALKGWKRASRTEFTEGNSERFRERAKETTIFLSGPNEERFVTSVSFC